MPSLLAAFIESVIFWLYLAYFTLGFKYVIQFSWLPWTRLNDHLLQFCLTFLVDYLWRRIFAVGNCTDTGVYIIQYIQKRVNAPKLDFIILHLLTCMAAGSIVYCMTSVIYPVTFAEWSPSYNTLTCFLIEFIFDFLHQARNAFYSIMEATYDQRGEPHASVHSYGIHSLASFYTAALIMEGSFLTIGGPMLNISYTAMAALAARSIPMFLTLGSANLLAAYCAGRYVGFSQIKSKQN